MIAHVPGFMVRAVDQGAAHHPAMPWTSLASWLRDMNSGRFHWKYLYLGNTASDEITNQRLGDGHNRKPRATPRRGIYDQRHDELRALIQVAATSRQTRDVCGALSV